MRFIWAAFKTVLVLPLCVGVVLFYFFWFVVTGDIEDGPRELTS